MNINEFQSKYSDLISEFEEENLNRLVIWRKYFTRTFLDWLLQQKNIKITVKYRKYQPYNHISEFFLNFLKEHAYFSKKLLIGIYKDEVHPSVDEYSNIKREFGELIHHHLKYGVLEHVSRDTYKINKHMVS